MPVIPYLPENGIRYARAFALHEQVPEADRLFYYSESDNCTNFISQCVWAAYGGWLPYGQTAENAARIRAGFRMVTGIWFGSQWHIGSTRWCRVEEFHTYVISSKTRGPAARMTVSGTFDTVAPSALQRGDVMQLVVAPYAPNRFGHGLYVTETGASWDEVRVCCQSYDRLDAPVSEFALYPEVYTRLRALRFSEASF